MSIYILVRKTTQKILRDAFKKVADRINYKSENERP